MFDGLSFLFQIRTRLLIIINYCNVGLSVNSIAQAQQEPFWLRPRLSWYCPSYCHMRTFVFHPGPPPGGYPWSRARSLRGRSGATPSP